MVTTVVFLILLSVVIGIFMVRSDLSRLDSFVREQAKREADREGRLATALRRVERLEATTNRIDDPVTSPVVPSPTEGFAGGRIGIEFRYAGSADDCQSVPRGVTVGGSSRPVTLVD